MNRIDQIMHQGLEEGVFPGAVLLCARYDRIYLHRGYGVTDPETLRQVNTDTVYDLASLTKPIATAAALMRLADEGKTGLKDRLGDIISDFKTPDKAEIRLEQLLCHTSGLPAYRPYCLALNRCRPGTRKQRLRELLAGETLVYRPGTATVYSDPGFMILQLVAEHISGCCLDEYVREFLYHPMGIKDLFFVRSCRAPEGYQHRIAPTQYPSVTGHGCVRVNDENAEAAGGVCGHAGLFGTAGAVYSFLKDLLFCASDRSESRVYSKAAVKNFLRIPDWALRAPGFDVPSGRDSSSGSYFTPGFSFGHLGFTGTSFWMDTATGIIIILLSNRVRLGRDNWKIKKFRPVIHDAAVEYMDFAG